MTGRSAGWQSGEAEGAEPSADEPGADDPGADNPGAEGETSGRRGAVEGGESAPESPSADALPETAPDSPLGSPHDPPHDSGPDEGQGVAKAGSKASRLLRESVAGNREATAQLMALLYDELRARARDLMKGERADHTLSATAVVHESYLRLLDGTQVDWEGQAHCLAVATRALRRVLLDHARARQTRKRGGGKTRMSLEEDLAWISSDPVDYVKWIEVMDKLYRIKPALSEIVDLRCAGWSVKEIALRLGVRERRIKKDLQTAREWLLREMEAGRGE